MDELNAVGEGEVDASRRRNIEVNVGRSCADCCILVKPKSAVQEKNTTYENWNGPKTKRGQDTSFWISSVYVGTSAKARQVGFKEFGGWVHNALGTPEQGRSSHPGMLFLMSEKLVNI